MVRLLYFCALACIAALAFMPSYKPLPTFVSLSDILNHFTAFFTLYWLHLLAFRVFSPLRRASLLLLYGTFIEVIQSFIPSRSASFSDLLVDASAIITAMMLEHIFLPVKPAAA